MNHRIIFSSFLLSIVVGCSGTDTPSGRGGSGNTTSGSGGSGGNATTGTGGSGGSTGGTTGTGGSTGGTTGTGGATGGTGGATGGTGGATGGTGGATGGTGGTGGATGGTGGATGGTGGATGGTGGATGGTGGATGGTGGTTGGTAGSAGAGGTGGAKDGGVVDSGTGGTGGAAGSGGTGGAADAGPLGTSKCGAPLFGPAPTETSINAAGPLTVAASYTAGLPTSADYKTLTVYYPSNGTGPYVMIAYAMGLTETGNLFSGWANRMASYGYVVGVVDAIDTNNSGEDRAKGQYSALQNLKAENTRAGSPLNGKLSNCMVTSGHSLGGGAAIKTGNDHPADIKGVIGLNPFNLSQGFSAIVAPTLIITGELDPTAPPAQHGKVAYDGIPATTMKQYVEILGGNHQSALSVNATTSRYAVAWMKYEVDGDARFKALLDKLATGLSDFQTTVK